MNFSDIRFMCEMATIGIRINKIHHFDIRVNKILDFDIRVKDIQDFAIPGIKFGILDCNYPRSR